MRKAAIYAKLFAALAACVLLLTACAGNTVTPHEDQFLITLRQDTTAPIYGVRCEYFIDGAPAGEAELIQMENDLIRPIRTGEAANLLFSQCGFPENADLSALSVRMYIIDFFGNETKAANDIVLAARYGSTYAFCLTGAPADYAVSALPAGGQAA